ncbi:MAG: PilZ domain-containing protein [Deltaproteobacteria bacterium]|nr:PilZ domain-containing protein [Deltaproteobacteria bacterium]
MEGERRRHARSSAVVSAQLDVQGSAWSVPRVLDVSAGGALLELAAGAPVPPLGARGRATLARGAVSVELAIRVVRVRWTGRERGRPLPPAVALVFDDGERASARVQQLLLG